MAIQDSNLGSYTVYHEDWLGGEPVILIETAAPNEVTNLTASNVLSTMVTLSWTASNSLGVTGYEVYNGDKLVGTTTDTAYEISGLTPATTYTFTVKAKNGSTSKGANVTLTTPKTTYVLSMNGTSDYVVTPVLTFDEVIVDLMAEHKSGAFMAYFDASRSIQQSAFLRSSAGIDLIQPAWRSIYINGIDQTALQGTTALVPSNQRVTVRAVLKSAGKAPLTFFANQIGGIPLKGTLHNIKVLLAGKIVAHYDFTQQFVGRAVPDQSGNNHIATLNGGTWIKR